MAVRFTVKQALDLDITDFMNLSGRELRAATKALADAANKRLSRLESAGIASPAGYEIRESGGKFRIGGKSEGELRTEFLRAKQFMEDPYSKVSEAKKAQREAAAALKERSKVGLTQDQYNKVLKTYLDNRNTNPNIIARTIKYQLMREQELSIPENADIEDIADRITAELMQSYEPGGAQYEGTAKYFDLEEDLFNW